MSEAALRERIEFLEADNANLRARLRLTGGEEFVALTRLRLKARPSTARLLWVLWDCRARTREALFDAIYGDRLDQPDIGIMPVNMFHLRKAVAHAGAVLTSHGNAGYQLLPDDRAKIAAYIGVEVNP